MRSSEKKPSAWIERKVPDVPEGRMILIEDRGAAELDAVRRALEAKMLTESEDSWEWRVGRAHHLAFPHRHSDPYLGLREPGFSSPSSNTNLSAEVSALRKEMAELKVAQRRTAEEVARLARVIEQSSAELHGVDFYEAPIDPNAAWIEANLEVLREYPNTWVVLDPERGIVFDTNDENELATKLAALSPGERERMTAFHTSLYV